MKKNYQLILIIVLISVLMICLGFFLTTSKKETPKKESKQEKETVENLEINNITQKDFEIIEKDIMTTLDNYDSYLSNEFPIKDIQKISSTKKTKFVLDILFKKDRSEVGKDEVLQEGKKYFSDFQPEEKDIEIAKEKYYFFLNNAYIRNLNTKDTNCKVQTNIVSTKVNNKEWVVKKKIFYINYSFNEKKSNIEIRVYKNYNDCVKSNNSIYNKTSNVISLDEEEYKKIQDKLNTASYYFKKDNSSYSLNSILID